MPKDIKKLEAEVLGLDRAGRAQLAEKLLLSLDAPADDENVALWVQEAERRLKALRAEKAQTRPVEEVLESARANIS
jgi:putative addiction module component (TIGR02574 family)